MKPVIQDMIKKIKKSLHIGEKKVSKEMEKVNDNLNSIKQWTCIKEVANN